MGDLNTRIVVVGNILHRDSLIMRLKDRITNNEMDGVFHAFPLIDKNGQCAWPEKFPDDQAIKKLKRSIGDETAWQKEYLLDISHDNTKIIQAEWIRKYEDLPTKSSDYKYQYTVTGIDLAISEKESADYTAMVTAKVYRKNKDTYIYIQSEPVCERLDFPSTIERAVQIDRIHNKNYRSCLLIEDVAYQRSAIQQLQEVEGCSVEAFSPHGSDKSSRLRSTTSAIKAGRVLFPEVGCEDLIDQLIDFDTELHDDLADAFSMVVLHVIENEQSGGLAGTGRGDKI